MINQVFEFRDIAISYEAAGGAGTFELYTDMPGGAMALRESISLPATTGKGSMSKTIDREAVHYRVKAIPPAGGSLRVYSATIQVRRIGVYLDGTRGEYYETQDIAVAI